MQLILEGRPLAIFPCWHNKKSSAGSHGFKDATSDPDEIEQLFRRYYGAPHIGVPTGEINGIDVLDVDPRRGGDKFLQENKHRLPETRVHRTRGGLHLIFRHAPIRSSIDRIAPGIEVKTDGRYVIWYPASPDPSYVYPVLCEGPVADWPGWFLELAGMAPVNTGDKGELPVTSSMLNFLEELISTSTLSVHPRSREASYAFVALKHAINELLNMPPESGRNAMLNIRAYGLGRLAVRGWITVKRIVEGLEFACEFNRLTRDTGLAEVRSTIASGLRAGMLRPYPDDMFREPLPERYQGDPPLNHTTGSSPLPPGNEP
jgi:hypothetical protein